MEPIRKPAAWTNASLDDLFDCEAGRAYVLEQLDPHSRAIAPDAAFTSDREGHDSATYEVYCDHSMWFHNNAEDEVWFDFRDFVAEQLIPGIEASSHGSRLFWSADDEGFGDEMSDWALDRMDRELLLRYCDGDVTQARELVNATSHSEVQG